MTERPEASPWLRLFGGFVVSASLAFSPQVLAQEESDEAAAKDDDVREEIVVTGSRLKRDTYSSISPLQIITGQVSREVGLIDAADILQESGAASGTQIDLTFQGFVLDNGPGSSTINLRGLGEARTLVLINGRRVAPAGVEGAPFAADLNLVPASLVQQYDLLLDGASSVYGSDAIAGVANIILRKDFDGFEVEAYSRVPEHGEGVDTTLSAVWGHNFDRGFVGFGAEYVDRERVKLQDRPWTSGCQRPAEIDENGQVRSTFLRDNAQFGMEIRDGCNRGALANRIIAGPTGSLYYTPGISNGGWPNYSESTLFGIGVDSASDGVADITFRDYSLGATQQDQDLFPEVQTQSAMAYGEYTFSGEANITPYFEVLYAERDFTTVGNQPQYFPVVPALNPFNPCNPNQPAGVDCGDALDELYENPGFVQQVFDAFGCTPNAAGTCPQGGGPLGPITAQPVVGVIGDRSGVDVVVDQTRMVLGLRGDMPFLQAGSLDNWSFDLTGIYSKSTGESHRVGIRDDRTDLALGWFSSTNTPCENDLNVELEPDAAPGCVPVNMFAPSLYPEGIIGDFATEAERDYLFDSRDFDTEYEQTLFSAYVTGDIFEIQGGPVALGIGLETRDDEINSIPDAVARDGLFFGFFSDGGAVGSKTTNEAFAEIELPIVAGKPGFQELTLNLSVRYTDDEFYGSDTTESYKLGWRPTESLLLRGTFGTSFRAPNLRELFLESQSGFLTLFDPCLIPDDALDPLTGTYIPGNDTREAQVLSNCLANGIDPTDIVAANNNGFNNYSMEVPRGGALDLEAERSESWSTGFSWDVPFTNAFNLSISTTYYEIEVTDTIIEPSGQFVINDCYDSLSGNSVFCSRIDRPQAATGAWFINEIDLGFLNRDKETARGVDINVAFDDTFTIFDRPIDFSADVIANRNLERSTLFVDDEGNADFDSFEGEWGFPAWRVQAFLRFDYDDFRFTWETNYRSSVSQDSRDVDDFDDVFGNSDACLGPAFGDVLCRDIGYTENYFTHNVSMYFYGDQWTFGGGIRNLFDEDPPFVDPTEVFTVRNTNVPAGVGYDLNGRVYFFNVAVSFGGNL